MNDIVFRLSNQLNSFMKKVFLFLAVSVITMSCSNDDDDVIPQEPFFNLQEGNLWVYEQYGVNELENISGFMNRVDSVRVIGKELIGGESYFNVQHKVYKYENLIDEKTEYLRVDENGHLVNSQGWVKHPGIDTEYQTTRITSGVEIKYTLQQKNDVNVDGVVYDEVFSYLGYIDDLQPTASRGMAHEVLYIPSLGIVSEKYIFIGSTVGYLEDRLVYYEIN